MAEINITQKDLDDAETFLAAFLAEKVPEGNFARGGALRDLSVKAFAYVYAYLRGEIDRVTARQSLLRIQAELTDADDIAQAVDEILSNWFEVRKDGLYARLVARLHFSARRAINIPLSSSFWRTNSLVFYVDDTTDPYVISEDQLFPVYDTRGVLIDFVAEIPLKAAKTGSEYVIDPGRFYRVQIPGGNSFFSYAEHLEKSSGGTDTESSTDLIARAETAITIRNLINNRSCDAVLQGLYPEITDTLTIGMGEEEMIRDRRTGLAPLLDIHVGGCYDTYVDMPLTQVDENLAVGGYFARPDGIANMFRDPLLTIDGGNTFGTVLGVQPGHVLFIRSGIVGTPRGFTIVSVSDHELEVSAFSPFDEASDELDTNNVQYSIGWLSPGFEEIDFGGGTYARYAQPSVNPLYSDIPYGTSRHIQAQGQVVLSGRPIQKILSVEVTDPDSGDPLLDPSTGTVIFRTRVNGAPDNAAAAAVPDPIASEYQLTVTNPDNSQSMTAVNKIVIGAPVGPYVGYEEKNLKVSYMTLSGFSNVNGYITDRSRRIAAANHLLRGRHPIWINFQVEYRIKPTSSGTFDTVGAAQQLAAYINAFDSNDDLDASDISAFLRNNYDALGTVYPFTSLNPIYYQLSVPDGQVVAFTTTDIVSIFEKNGVALYNAADLIPPPALQSRGIITISTSSDLEDWFYYAGISDRTIKYRTDASLITFLAKA